MGNRSAKRRNAHIVCSISISVKVQHLRVRNRTICALGRTSPVKMTQQKTCKNIWWLFRQQEKSAKRDTSYQISVKVQVLRVRNRTICALGRTSPVKITQQKTCKNIWWLFRQQEKSAQRDTSYQIPLEGGSAVEACCVRGSRVLKSCDAAKGFKIM